jgi:hypothetical protein
MTEQPSVYKTTCPTTEQPNLFLSWPQSYSLPSTTPICRILVIKQSCQEYAYVIGASVKTLIKGAGVLPHHHYHYNYYLEHIIKNLLNTISLVSI